jgi:hypothetical protein
MVLSEDAHVDAELLFHDRMAFPDGRTVEMTIWRRPHGLKYSLFYGGRGERIVGYDNERGKGDHRHYGPREERYAFTDVETLIQDFLADVRNERGKE